MEDIISYFGFMLVGFFLLMFFTFTTFLGQKKKKIFAVILTLCIGGLLALLISSIAINTPIYRYSVKLHYIDGYSKIVVFESAFDPEIRGTRGVYLFMGGDVRELGVIRYEIQSKEILNNE